MEAGNPSLINMDIKNNQFDKNNVIKCSNCLIEKDKSEFYTKDKRCKPCKYMIQKERRKNNPSYKEYQRNYKKNYVIQNKDKIKEYNIEYYKNNKSHISDKCKKWFQKNKDKINEKRRNPDHRLKDRQRYAKIEIKFFNGYKNKNHSGI